MSTENPQRRLMKFDPQDRSKAPYPSDSEQYRIYHGLTAWLYNPWNGEERDPRDIGSDIQGHAISD